MAKIAGVRSPIGVTAVMFGVAAVLLVVQAAFAQENLERKRMGLRSKPPEVLGISDIIEIPMRTPLEEALEALDGLIDPQSYRVGPGDQIAISFRGSDLFFQVHVTPEGMLIMPKVPMVDIGGMTLADAVVKIKSEWEEVLSGKTVDIALLEVRSLRATISGPVYYPGMYIATAADRASTLIDLAGGLIHDQELVKFRRYRRSFSSPVASSRRAFLIHNDGRREHVDILRYERSGSKDANPMLTEGATLIIEPYREEAPRVQIAGGVLYPGDYEWVEEDRLLDLIEVAGGMINEIKADSVFVRHGNPYPAGGEIEALSLAELLESGERGPLIEPWGQILIRTVERPRMLASVVVEGEVKFPGGYGIEESVTTISEVIEMAGGFTGDAFVAGGRVWVPRQTSDFMNMETTRIDSSRIGRTRIEASFNRTASRWPDRDLVPADFEKIFGDGTDAEEADIALFDKVVISIPSKMMSVMVTGQVVNPGYYAYVENWNYRDYIQKAGGFASRARRGSVRLAKYMYSVWYEPSKNDRILPGDTIFVPEKLEDVDWTSIRGVLSILTTAATLALFFLKVL